MAFAYDAPAEDDEMAGGEAMSELPGIDDQQKPEEQALAKLQRWSDPQQTLNIADELEPELLGAIGQRVVREYDIDNETRSAWIEQTRAAMDLAMQVAKQKDYPWPKAANVIFPLMTTAAMQFAARAYPAIVNGRNVVKGIVVGDDDGQAHADQQGNPIPGPDGGIQWAVQPGAKRARADRIGDHMSWQLLEEMPEWEPETDTLLHMLPIVGCVFRKTYFDSSKGRNCSHLVSAQNLVVNYTAKSLDLAPRLTEEIKLYPLEINERERSGSFIENEYGAAENGDGDDDAPHDFLEQHRYLDLDDDDYPEPYIVTVHKRTARVVRIVARYEMEGVRAKQDGKITKIEPVHYYTKYDFIPNSDGGIYGMGFGQILKPINEAVNSTLNQLLDAGHLANTAGGFIGKGLSMHTGAIRFSMGEFKPVNANGQDIRNSIVPIDFKGPSPVLFNLLGMLIEAGKEVASIKDVLSGDLSSQTMQPTTALAMIEQGLKVFTAIYKRVHRSLKAELEKLYRLNRVYMDDQSRYRVGDEWRNVSRQDYSEASGVEPISDPGMVSDQQRMARAQFMMQFMNDPMCNGLEIRRRVFNAAQMEDAEKLLNTEPPPPPPQVVQAGLELDLRDREVKSKEQLERSTEMKNLAQAVQALSAAAATGMAADQGWASHQLDVLRLQMETLSGGAGDGEGAPQQPQGGPGMTPPRGGGQVAPDGNMYFPDPQRPGKYLMLDQGGGGPAPQPQPQPDAVPAG